jgi:hypothetical protein
VQSKSRISDAMIDQDNLKSDESVGTFRWNDSVELLPIANFLPEHRLIVAEFDKGWQGYVKERFSHTAIDNTIQIEPHQLDGLSFSMTVANLIKVMKLHQDRKELNIIVMGGSAKAEERLFACTNYFEELTNFYPGIKFKFFFAGPELSDKRHCTVHKVNDNLTGFFYKAKVSELILDHFESIDNFKKQCKEDNTFFIGFNPGFGCGYEALLASWAQDLVMLLNMDYHVIFT